MNSWLKLRILMFAVLIVGVSLWESGLYVGSPELQTEVALKQMDSDSNQITMRAMERSRNMVSLIGPVVLALGLIVLFGRDVWVLCQKALSTGGSRNEEDGVAGSNGRSGGN